MSTIKRTPMKIYTFLSTSFSCCCYFF